MPPSVLAPLLSLSTVTAIAHRGGSALRPENTMLAFDHAVALGVDAIECDVHLSRDDEVVIIHDATLERTTGDTGPVARRTADELARVDAGFRFGADQGFPYRSVGAGVPRLADALARFPDTPFIIEIKGEQARVAERALEVVRQAGAVGRVIIGGFSAAVLDAVRRSANGPVTSASLPEVRSALRRSYLWMPPRRTGFGLFQVPVRLKGQPILTRAFVRAARRAAIPVQAWIVDELDEMRRLIDWGVTGLISDRPDVALEAARASGRRAQDPR